MLKDTKSLELFAEAHSLSFDDYLQQLTRDPEEHAAYAEAYEQLVRATANQKDDQ